MTTLEIRELLAASPVEHDRHLDPGRVEHYRRHIDHLLPVVVFETEEGLLLVDGYHRLAAAIEESRNALEADVRIGSRREALELAAELGAAQRGVSKERATERILRRGEESSARPK